MASKRLRTAFVSTVTEVEAGESDSHNTETLICYTVCYPKFIYQTAKWHHILLVESLNYQL